MLGSQSSRIAAYKLGFDFYGCELDPLFFRKGDERFRAECQGTVVLPGGRTVTQPSLFD